MKKILLATTALGMFAAGAAHAEGPTVTVGGFMDFQFANTDQNSVFTEVGDGRFNSDSHTRHEAELHFKIDGKTDNGLGYGAYIELEANVNPDDGTGTTTNNAENGYIYVESGFGRVEVGPTYDAGSSLKVDAGTLARATGGIAGDFYNFAALSSASQGTDGNDNFYVLPGLPTLYGNPGVAVDGTNSGPATANKISYYSPRISGVQLGVSFTPDQGERGTAVGLSGKGTSNGQFRDVWNAGLNYQGQYESIGVEASVTGEWGDVEEVVASANTLDDLKAYAAGLNVSYAGFTAGGSWGNVDEYGQTKTMNSEITYWTLGGAYEFGPFAASVTYMSSEVENGTSAGLDNEFDNLVIGADYQLAPGLVPYVEVSFFDTDDNDATTTSDNDGTIVLIGTELNF
ncbi:porin [Rickettsiales bacterium]|nr:porin [Rickettsiales bacterium]